MNHSLLTADKSTHVKVVGVAIFAAIFAAGLGLSARTQNDRLMAVSSAAHTAQLANSVTSDIARLDREYSNHLLR